MSTKTRWYNRETKDKEIETQVLLSIYQTDVQVYLSYALALFAGVLAIAAIEYQIISMGIAQPGNLVPIIAFVVCLLLSFILVSYTYKAVAKLKVARQSLERIKKKTCKRSI